MSDDGRAKRILCIDDDADTCELVRKIMQIEGHEVIEASTYADALSLARRGGVDLILLDWHLPDGSGVELCRAIRAFDKSTPILFYSAETGDEEVERAIRAGAQGYLKKPAALDEFLREVSLYLGAAESV